MHITSRTVLVVVALAAAGCAEPADERLASAAISEGLTVRKAVAPLPCFQPTPNIAAAAASRLPRGTWVRALYLTESGEQIYRCERNVQGAFVWALRTPLAHLVPSRLTELRLGTLAASYHHRSDFGGLLTPLEVATLGLVDGAGVTGVAPIWAFTFAAPEHAQVAEEREVVAGRVVAQDTIGTGNIPNLLIEVRGRSVAGLVDGIVVGATAAADPDADPIAASDYLLRWNLRGGLAPAASLCSEAALGTESHQPYLADYYFLETTPSS